MYSISFPEMFNGGVTNLVQDHEATMSNLRLLLASWKKSLFGDPYFGTNLKSLMYNQNNIILRDIIIDDILVSIQQFLPQIYVQRKDIKLTLKGTEIFVSINCINKLDSELNTYEINLTADE